MSTELPILFAYVYLMGLRSRPLIKVNYNFPISRGRVAWPMSSPNFRDP